VNRSDALIQTRALRNQIALLRPLQVDSPMYKLWLGDTVELVEAVWGTSSPQMARIVGALRENPTLPRESGSDARYIARLNRLHSVLLACEGELASDL
jgi:hypothetical protein